jgi:tryptophan 2,3-dioxygenase
MTDQKSYLEQGIIAPDGSMVTYGSYLKVNELLSLQERLSNPAEHDEMLFIIIHQVYELWFKQILHEMNLGETELSQNNPFAVLKTLKRITTIQRTLTDQVSILETMTPNDFNRFRERLNPASGFQSWQFRLVEYRMGLKDDAFLKFFKSNPKAIAAMEHARNQPSFYDYVLRFLNRNGFEIPKETLDRDVTQYYEPSTGVENTFVAIYRDSVKYSNAYVLLEALMDLDQQFTLWRYRHVAMVERMIGSRTGTGGSSGVKYLTQTLNKRFFPELWSLRSQLGTHHY